MKTKLNINRLICILFFLISIVSVSAQNATASSRNSSLISLSEYLENYKEKYLNFSKSIEAEKGISVAEKLTLHQNKISNLKEEFKNTRELEYLSKKAKRAKRMSCVGTHTRNVTKCHPEYIYAPNENMYTKRDWITIEATKKIEVSTDSATVSLSLSANGKRTNKAVVFATYKYKPKNVKEMVNKEATDIFNQLILK